MPKTSKDLKIRVIWVGVEELDQRTRERMESARRILPKILHERYFKKQQKTK